jgi:hypothetical protein
MLHGARAISHGISVEIGAALMAGWRIEPHCLMNFRHSLLLAQGAAMRFAATRL